MSAKEMNGFLRLVGRAPCGGPPVTLANGWGGDPH